MLWRVSFSGFLVWLSLHDQIQVEHLQGEHNVGGDCISSGRERITSGDPTLGATEFDHMVGGYLRVSHCAGICSLLSLVINL